MSLFSVEWPPDILSDLADIWLQAPDRQAVTDAESEIDRLLGGKAGGRAENDAERNGGQSECETHREHVYLALYTIRGKAARGGVLKVR